MTFFPFIVKNFPGTYIQPVFYPRGVFGFLHFYHVSSKLAGAGAMDAAAAANICVMLFCQCLPICNCDRDFVSQESVTCALRVGKSNPVHGAGRFVFGYIQPLS
jgi:hypothetical protein